MKKLMKYDIFTVPMGDPKFGAWLDITDLLVILVSTVIVSTIYIVLLYLDSYASEPYAILVILVLMLIQEISK